MKNKYTYTPTLSKMMRNVAVMVREAYGETNKSQVVLESFLELMTVPANVAPAKKAFLYWYRLKYQPEAGGSDLLIEQLLSKETPLSICGMLNEYADQVDQIVDTANTLDRAAGAIDEYGWRQGRSGNCQSGFCLVGAVDYIVSTSERPFAHQWQTWGRCTAVLREYLQTHDIVAWNDTPGRTGGEVANVLRETAAGIRMMRLA